jgi:hypothetical protein
MREEANCLQRAAEADSQKAAAATAAAATAAVEAAGENSPLPACPTGDVGYKGRRGGVGHRLNE